MSAKFPPPLTDDSCRVLPLANFQSNYTQINPIILEYNCTMYCTLESTHLQIQLFWSTIVQCTVYYTILTLTTPIILEYNCTMYCTTLQYYALKNPIILDYNCTMYCTTLQYYTHTNPIILEYNCTMYTYAYTVYTSCTVYRCSKM